MTELSEVIKCTEQNRRIKIESSEDISTLLNIWFKTGKYDSIESYLNDLSPKTFSGYERHKARLDLALAGVA